MLCINSSYYYKSGGSWLHLAYRNSFYPNEFIPFPTTFPTVCIHGIFLEPVDKKARRTYRSKMKMGGDQ